MNEVKAWTNYLYKLQSTMSLKNWLCCRCLSEFKDWRYSQPCWYFRPSFVNCCPSNILSGSTLPPSPLFPVWIRTLCNTYTVCKGGGGYEVLGGPQTDKHLPQSTFLLVNFFRWSTFCIAFYESNIPTGNGKWDCGVRVILCLSMLATTTGPILRKPSSGLIHKWEKVKKSPATKI